MYQLSTCTMYFFKIRCTLVFLYIAQVMMILMILSILLLLLIALLQQRGRDGGDERGETEATTRRRRRRQQREMNLMYMCIVVHVDGKKMVYIVYCCTCVLQYNMILHIYLCSFKSFRCVFSYFYCIFIDVFLLQGVKMLFLKFMTKLRTNFNI